LLHVDPALRQVPLSSEYGMYKTVERIWHIEIAFEAHCVKSAQWRCWPRSE